ncbi:DUF6113 family protein [Planomonospora corallina]|uniref:DUF6113 family protein n=1 Tax=Planomonospora corallina TaxID=1806052 RepID=A0ABV8I2A9_9ACTN
MEHVPEATRAPGEVTARPSRALAAAVYAALFLLGLLMGLLGGFQHSWYIRPVPVSALAWVAGLFAVCHGAGRAMRGRGAAVAPAVGWAAVTMLWLGVRPEGDLVIADDLSGYVYLYGGLLAALAGVLTVPARGGSWLLSGYAHPGPARPGPS